MIKHLALISMVFLCLNIYSQSHATLFERDILLKNNVYKILEYDHTDSINYFTKYPDGKYSNCDSYGRITVSNFYSPTYLDSIFIPGEFKLYYMYDSSDNQIGIIRVNEMFTSPIDYVYLATYDSNGVITKSTTLRSNGISNSKIEYSDGENFRNKTVFSDTITVSKLHLKVIYNEDSLYYTDLYYNNNNQLDSTVYHGTGNDAKHKFYIETKRSFYYENGILVKEIEQHYKIANTKSLMYQYEYFYLENGLLDVMTSYHTINDRRSNSKFKYYIRKN